MTKWRLTGTLALGIVFAGTMMHYAFYQPFMPGEVSKAVPMDSTFAYHADSLEELLQSPVCAQLDKTLGAGNTLRELLESNDWTKLVAPSEIAVTDIPYHQADQRKSWAAASWVGWRSPLLRLKLEHASNANLHFLGKHSVWPVWQYESPDIARGMSLTFSLTDNLFLACLSESPVDIVSLLDAYDRQSCTNP